MQHKTDINQQRVFKDEQRIGPERGLVTLSRGPNAIGTYSYTIVKQAQSIGKELTDNGIVCFGNARESHSGTFDGRKFILIGDATADGHLRPSTMMHQCKGHNRENNNELPHNQPFHSFTILTVIDDISSFT